MNVSSDLITWSPTTIQVGSTADNGDGTETVTIRGLKDIQPRMETKAEITMADGSKKEITLLCRIDTLDELEYVRNGGILHYVLRNMAKAA